MLLPRLDNLESALSLAPAAPLLLMPLRQPDAATPPTEAHLKPMHAAPTAVGPFALESADDARAWLNAGARYAIFEISLNIEPTQAADALKSLCDELKLPAERILLLVRVTSGPLSAAHARLVNLLEAVAAPKGDGCRECEYAATAGLVGGAWVDLEGADDSPSRQAEESELMAALAPLAKSDRLMLVASGSTQYRGLEGVGQLHALAIHLAATASVGPLPSDGGVPGAATTLPGASSPVDIGLALCRTLRTDRPDGMFTTVVIEEGGPALGLVYSTEESICAALRCGRGVYWSRSRSSLWRKGDTSGAWQQLVRVDADCDRDALRFIVRQKGSPPAFCHRKTLHCWGASTGLRGLQETLQARLVSAPEGSYTKRLFDDAELLRNKLVEEAQELSEATEPDHVAAEAADLMYFAMVRCVAAGVSIADVEAHLDRRALKVSRRPGNSKPERIAAAAAILGE